MEDDSTCSSMVTTIPQTSFLRRILDRLSSTNCLRLEAEEADPVAVISLQRYLSEQADGYSYDLTVTDGVWRAKCFLHSGLNQLVHKNILKTGAEIRITRCSFQYNERRLGHGYMCIDELRCGGDRSTILSAINDVCSLPMLMKQGTEKSVLLQMDAPLQLSRKHYLSLWNNDAPEGDMWRSGSSSSDTVLDVSRIVLLSSLDSGFRDPWKCLPLLVKIIHKSRLRYYGRSGLQIDYPYQAYFEVADQSGTMSLVLWNELCPEFYQRLTVGTVLHLQNYALKQSYSNRSRPQMDHHRMQIFNSVEICLNHRNPTAMITVIPPKNVRLEWMLPNVSYQFIRRSELDKLAHNEACDVIGLVTFVGRVERVKSKVNKGPEKYWTYRWVHAVDGTSDHPFVLELFSSSQVDIFSQICPMTYLVCTQMRVCHVEGSLPFLTSSCETEMFVTGCHKGQPYVNDARVKDFIQWTKTQKDNVVLQRTAVGGHYCYPHPPRAFTQSAAATSAQVALVSAEDLKQELASLQYREHKKLAIQGQITAVRYMGRPKTLHSHQLEDEKEVPDQHSRSSAAEQETCLPSPSSDCSSAGRGKRRVLIRKAALSSNNGGTSAKRKLVYENANNEDGNCDSASEEHVETQSQSGDSNALSWESSSWATQRQEVSEHLSDGGLYEDSVSRRFAVEEKDALLQWGNLPPTRWHPDDTADAVPPTNCSGFYQVTILGINKRIAVDAAYFPVVSSDDPRTVGLPQEPHGNTMMSCLSSGFLCPLIDAASHSEQALPEPNEILASAGELDDTHVVCVLDLCHLGGDDVEIVINKVYKVSEVSLN